MFRKLRREKQQLSQEQCIALLEKETWGVLSVLGEKGYPYGMPMNHFYNPTDGKLYFHCGHGGHREEALKHCNKVSFCVTDSGYRPEGEWARRVQSVILFGKMEIIDEEQKVREIVTPLCYKFTDDAAYIQRELDSAAHKTRLLCMTIEHICGKRVVEE